ncbi:acetyl-CoA carboxylase biotin carboxyl carrier protein subunit [bacterium BMS3Abin03]|jgi:biotin carboxyl carrier protein|nr:acetyl-CoA carboxylase biotin carboxyl carrier protein subunit [bacterium BMS3Abin03]MCG6960332.1 acetyl-CoA carboxylase biotin carboxyl carrier protein subunit [bacterium BMS3Abin03]
MSKNFIVTINGSKKQINILNSSVAIIDKKKVDFELLKLKEDNYLLRINNYFYEICTDKIDHEKYSLFVNGNKIDTITRTELQEKAARLINEAKISSNNKLEIKAPMPGLILKIKKKVGEVIKQGESILILEAMKMENDLRTPVSGSIIEIFVTEGIAVEKGDKLFTIE